MINVPGTTREWTQTNESDLFGSVWVTKNVTFDRRGYLRLSYSPRAVIDESTSNFNNPAAIIFSADYGYFVATWDNAWQADLNILLIRPTQIATAGVPSTDVETDVRWFGGLMVVSQDTDVDYYDPNTNAWTDTNITLTAGGQHPIEDMLNIAAIAIADINTVKLYSAPLTATPTLVTTLTIMSDFQITGTAYFNQNTYIGTHNIYGGHAFLYVWNGTGTGASQAYEVDSNIILDVCVHQDQVVLVTGNGSLLQFNGSGFDLLGAFPIYYTDQALANETNIPMYHNMLQSNGETLLINFSNQLNNANRLLSQPDGIWCYDRRVGLYHRYALSNSMVGIEVITTGNVNTTTNQITVASAPVTGTETYYNNGGGSSISPLSNNTKYFVIRIDATHIQLALTKADALAGTPIDLSTTGNNLQRFVFFPNIDFGQYYLGRTFAQYVIERPVTNRQYGTEILWGAEVTRRDSTSDYGTLGTVSTGVESRGYFITPKIFSNEVTDDYNRLTLKFSPFTSELDSIIIKYRTYDDMRYYVDLTSTDWSITWTSTNTFTTTGTVWADAIRGNEVEILQGAGAGLLAHIESIVNNAGTYTVTLDDSYADYISGDIGKAVFRNWKKLVSIAYGDSNAEQFFYSNRIGADGKFIQIKVEVRGVQVFVEDLLINDVTRMPAKD